MSVQTKYCHFSHNILNVGNKCYFGVANRLSSSVWYCGSLFLGERVSLRVALASRWLIRFHPWLQENSSDLMPGSVKDSNPARPCLTTSNWVCLSWNGPASNPRGKFRNCALGGLPDSRMSSALPKMRVGRPATSKCRANRLTV